MSAASKPKSIAQSTEPGKSASSDTTPSNPPLEQLHILIKNAQVELNDIKNNNNKLLHEKKILHDICTSSTLSNNKLFNDNYIISNSIDTILNTHHATIDTYINKVTHMQYEHKNINHELDNSINNKLQQLQDQSDITTIQFNTMKSELLDLMKHDNEKYTNEINKMKELESKELVKLTENFQSSYQSQQSLYESNLIEINDNLCLYHRMKLHEINERKNLHIHNLIQQHEQSIEQVKQYYKNITQDNLLLISQLNTQLNTLKSQYATNQQLIVQITDDNQKNNIPLQSSVNQLNSLQLKLQHYEKNKLNLKINKNRLLQLKQQSQQLKSQYDELLQQYESSESERDTLLSNYTASIQYIQQQSNHKNQQLQQNITELENEFINKKLQFQQILNVSNLDQTMLNNVTNKLDVLLNEKNQVIQNLKYEITKHQKNHSSVIDYYNTQLKQHGVDVDQNENDQQLAQTQQMIQQLAV